ncbi:hypothetical protein GLT90_02155 [Nanohaloarchaea archaeon H12]|nr:hypothetical protein [Nanohaloarchaea archaeon H12]
MNDELALDGDIDAQKQLITEYGNDAVDQFHDNRRQLHRQHRIYDLITHNIARMAYAGYTLEDMADVLETKQDAVREYLKRNGYRRMKNLFRACFKYYNAVHDNDERKGKGVGYWEGLSLLRLNCDYNHAMENKQFDVTGAAVFLSYHPDYNEWERSWKAFAKSSGLIDRTYLEIFLRWNNTNGTVRYAGMRREQYHEMMLAVLHDLEGETDEQDIIDNLRSFLDSVPTLDLNDNINPNV